MRAESLRGGKPKQGRRMDGTSHGLPVYATHLVAQGWAAGWAASRHVQGAIEVHGCLQVATGAYRDTEPRIRGQIVRLRRVTETLDTSDPIEQNWRPIPARRVLTDIDALPERATDPDPRAAQAPGSPTSGHWTLYTGDRQGEHRYTQIVIDLDIDDGS